MHSVLAIDTATEVCSVAWVSDHGERRLSRDLPRAHNRHLLAMVDEILGEHSLDAVTHLACGVGPGSFTGLRIAVATIQGLAWPRDLPVAGYCSLAAQAVAAGQREGWVLSTIDAQIDQLYGAWFQWIEGALVPLTQPWIAAPEAVVVPDADGGQSLSLLGSGATYQDRLSIAFTDVDAAARPDAQVIAESMVDGRNPPNWQAAATLSPRYVQEDVGWKKLSEQGPRD